MPPDVCAFRNRIISSVTISPRPPRPRPPRPRPPQPCPPHPCPHRRAQEQLAGECLRCVEHASPCFSFCVSPRHGRGHLGPPVGHVLAGPAVAPFTVTAANAVPLAKPVGPRVPPTTPCCSRRSVRGLLWHLSSSALNSVPRLFVSSLDSH